MARQGLPKHKVISSGRLTSCGRGQGSKKKVSGRSTTAVEPGYSLYSTDSEDQVTTIHKGLDRCAALLNGILQAEKAAVQPSSSKVVKTAPSRVGSKVTSGQAARERKRQGKRSNSAAHTVQRPGPVQKTVLFSRSYPGIRGQPFFHAEPTPIGDPVQGSNTQLPAETTPETTPGLTTATQWERVQTHITPQACGNSLPSAGLQSSTVFNCRLTTSTPAFSPQQPTSTHSQPCVSNCVQGRGASDGEMQHFIQHWATGRPAVPHGAITAAVPHGAITAAVPHGAITAAVPPMHEEAVANMVLPATALPPLHHGPVPPGQGTQGLSDPLLSVLPTGTSEPSVSRPPPSIGSAVSGSSSLTTRALQVPVAHPQPYPHDPYPPCARAQQQVVSSGESEEYSEEEDQDAVDTTPVRDTSCQTSLSAHTHTHTHTQLLLKPCSPQKTARKFLTVKHLLGKLKTLVANQDSEALWLISEVEQSIAMVNSTNVQAELALVLQPLRSENVQLRRRLRTLNQQLLERERAEREARPPDCDLEMVSLQSLNLTLQTQLNKTRKDLEDLQQENKQLRQAVEDMASELHQSREQRQSETSRIRMVGQALAERRSCQSELDASERENAALAPGLRQRETENRSVQRSICGVSAEKEKGVSAPIPQLTKHALDLHEDEHVSQHVSDPVKTYLQTLDCSPPRARLSPQRASPPCSPGQGQSGRPSERRACSPRGQGGCGSVGRSSSGSPSRGLGGTPFTPLRETGRAQPPVGAQRASPALMPLESLAGLVGLKYLGQALEKLHVSNRLSSQAHAPDDLRRDGVASSYFQPTSQVTAAPLGHSQHPRRRLELGGALVYTERPSALDNTVSSCDIQSLASDWSVNSWSTFNTRDEQDFRQGLAALDASIASLQNTLQADLKK